MEALKHEILCEQCLSLPLSLSQTKKHIYMSIAFQKEDLGIYGSQTIYRCNKCKTHWMHQTDKWKSCLGFKLWSENNEKHKIL